MKSNIIRYFLVAVICVASMACAQKTYAFRMWDLEAQSQYSYGNILSNSQSPQELLYNTNSFYVGTYAYYLGNINSLTNTPSGYFSRAGRFSGIYTWNFENNNRQMYVSNIKYEEDGQGGLNFSHYSPGRGGRSTFNVPSRAGMLEEIGGSSVNLDQVYFWHNQIIFQSSTTLDTLSIMGDLAYQNKVYYCDPLEEGQNLWLIDFKRQKAWSLHTTKNECFAIMLGDKLLTVPVQNSFNWQYSYTLSRGGRYFFPNTIGYINGKYGIQQTYLSVSNGDVPSVGRVYSQDLVFQDPPVVNPGVPDLDTDGSVILPSYESFSDYNQCLERFESLSAVANAWYSCRLEINNGLSVSDYNSMVDYVLQYDGVSIYPGVIDSAICNVFLSNARRFYEINSGFNYSYYIDLARQNSTVPNGMGDSALYCGISPDGSTPGVGGIMYSGSVSDSSNTSCNLGSWQGIINCLGFGNSTIGSGNDDKTLFTIAIDNVKEMINGPLYSTFINPLKVEYEAGKSVIGVYSCSTHNTFEYGDSILYVVAVLLAFVLYGVLL